MSLPQHIIIGIKSSASHNAARILLRDGKKGWKAYLDKFDSLLAIMRDAEELTTQEYLEISTYARMKSRMEARMVRDGIFSDVSGDGGAETTLEAQFEHFRMVISSLAASKDEE